MTKITEHFTREEFDCHDHTPYPSEWIPVLKNLCAQLEVIRSVWNLPIKVISGYRTLEYNTKISGASDSYHMKGMASDIQIAGIPAKDVHKAIKDLFIAGKIRIGGLGLYKDFVHVDTRENHSKSGSSSLVEWDYS